MESEKEGGKEVVSQEIKGCNVKKRPRGSGTGIETEIKGHKESWSFKEIDK